MYKFEQKKEQKVVESDSIGCFYSFVNKKLSNKKGVGALRASDGDVFDDGQRANLLNNYFSSVCTADDGNTPSITRVVPDGVSLDTVDFSPAKVLAAIKKLKHNKSGGPDGFPPLLFKRLAPALAKPLSLIYGSLMSVGRIPSEWAHAFVTPILQRWKCIGCFQLQAYFFDKRSMQINGANNIERYFGEPEAAWRYYQAATWILLGLVNQHKSSRIN